MLGMLLMLPLIGLMAFLAFMWSSNLKYLEGVLVQFEAIFRINPENGQEEYVREKLNNGLILDDIDVHCLVDLIKILVSEARVLGLGPRFMSICITKLAIE
ncbi:rho GTPase-activating protein 4-like [Salvia miltiorrhiza]|uniref:rho GTPase-activating protein 4-like n=1 Tax=Salvia miltiorrhiza TaxID=226208 RepID=UPI0025AC81D8|nr:rho GTPase-activating protein 4-like [Salvia miltiorrhiza]XP_057805746.1 rho GTPase-activating protein 4-like [Salvia miltiorrhiza]